MSDRSAAVWDVHRWAGRSRSRITCGPRLLPEQVSWFVGNVPGCVLEELGNASTAIWRPRQVRILPGALPFPQVKTGISTPYRLVLAGSNLAALHHPALAAAVAHEGNALPVSAPTAGKGQRPLTNGLVAERTPLLTKRIRNPSLSRSGIRPRSDYGTSTYS
jgi:hypothetical protein